MEGDAEQPQPRQQSHEPGSSPAEDEEHSEEQLVDSDLGWGPESMPGCDSPDDTTVPHTTRARSSQPGSHGSDSGMSASQRQPATLNSLTADALDALRGADILPGGYAVAWLQSLGVVPAGRPASVRTFEDILENQTLATERLLITSFLPSITAVLSCSGSTLVRTSSTMTSAYFYRRSTLVSSADSSSGSVRDSRHGRPGSGDLAGIGGWTIGGELMELLE